LVFAVGIPEWVEAVLASPCHELDDDIVDGAYYLGLLTDQVAPAVLAVRLSRQIVELHLAHYGGDHPDTWGAVFSLCGSLMDDRRWSDVEAELARLHGMIGDFKQRVESPELDGHSFWGDPEVRPRSVRLELAEANEREIIKWRSKSLGRQGLWSEALDLDREYLRLLQGAPVIQRPEWLLLQAAGDAALCQLHKGGVQVAIREFRDLCGRAETLLGATHSVTGELKHNLALALQWGGHLEEAQQRYLEILESDDFGARWASRETRTTQLQLARNSCRLGRWEQAETMYRELISVSSGLYGEEVVWREVFSEELAVLLNECGAAVESFQVFLHALRQAASVGSSTHSRAIRCRRRLELVLLECGFAGLALQSRQCLVDELSGQWEPEAMEQLRLGSSFFLVAVGRCREALDLLSRHGVQPPDSKEERLLDVAALAYRGLERHDLAADLFGRDYAKKAQGVHVHSRFTLNARVRWLASSYRVDQVTADEVADVLHAAESRLPEKSPTLASLRRMVRESLDGAPPTPIFPAVPGAAPLEVRQFLVGTDGAAAP